MRKINRKLLAFALISLCLISFSAFAKEKKNLPKSLQTSLGRLDYTNDEIILKLKEECPSSRVTGRSNWAITLQNLSDFNKELEINNKENTPEVKISESGFSLVYSRLLQDGKTWNLSLKLDFSLQGEAFRITGNIENRETEWAVVGFTGPIINGLQADLSTHPLLMPCGLGQKFIKEPSSEPAKKDNENDLNYKYDGELVWKPNQSNSVYEISANYPSRFATMQWCAFAGENGGLYLGSHDKNHEAKKFIVRYYTEDKTFGAAFKYLLACAPGDSWAIPPLVVYPYVGSWHHAADFYRAWYNTSIQLQKVPVWAQNASGWMLTILKQQNDEIMWNYESLDEICRISTERGLDIIGLFGWAHGGHDRFYPDYHPDTAMGGRDALMKALCNIRKQGKRSIIYANGQLIDQNGTDYWDENGKQITVVKKDGSYDYQKWQKFTDAPTRYHGMACLGMDAWYERMLELALQANELGADGILYDQLAVSGPRYCYATNHGHKAPAVVYTSDRYRLLNRIATHMKTINPDFVVMTEGLCDAVLGSIAYFHAYENGAYAPMNKEIYARINKKVHSYIYPEMFKYTFPEVLTTTRNPAPVTNRATLNYATVFGLRQDMESRYSADVKYLKEGRIPVIEDYENVIWKPNLELVTTEDPVASKIYIRQVIDFQRENSDLLWKGKYMDDKGFAISCGRNIIAKAFVNNNRMGIVVWNAGADDEEFLIDVPGYTFDLATEPGKGNVNIAEKLAPETIRLLIWKK